MLSSPLLDDGGETGGSSSVQQGASSSSSSPPPPSKTTNSNRRRGDRVSAASKSALDARLHRLALALLGVAVAYAVLCAAMHELLRMYEEREVLRGYGSIVSGFSRASESAAVNIVAEVTSHEG